MSTGRTFIRPIVLCPHGTLDALHLATALIWRERMGPLSVVATHDTARHELVRCACIDGIVKDGGVVKGQRKMIIVQDDGTEPRAYALPPQGAGALGSRGCRAACTSACTYGWRVHLEPLGETGVTETRIVGDDRRGLRVECQCQMQRVERAERLVAGE